MLGQPHLSPDDLCEMVVLVNRRGLHARAAARFAREAALFEADIHVMKGDMRVSGRSIMGLMMLAAPQGTRLSLCAAGPGAADALAALGDLVRRGFDEE